MVATFWVLVCAIMCVPPFFLVRYVLLSLDEGIERDTQHFTLHLASPCKEMRRVRLPLAKLGGGRQTGAALLLLCDNGELIVNVCLVLGRRSLVGFRKEGPE